MSDKAEEYFNSRPAGEKKLDQELVCSICGQTFVSHFNLHEGHRLRLYGDVWCCNDCWDSNWDGFVCDDILLKILSEKRLPVPNRNARGWFPRS